MAMICDVLFLFWKMNPLLLAIVALVRISYYLMQSSYKLHHIRDDGVLWKIFQQRTLTKSNPSISILQEGVHS